MGNMAQFGVMETPRTEKRANEILRDVERMKLDEWSDAYHEMRRHAETLENELALILKSNLRLIELELRA